MHASRLILLALSVFLALSSLATAGGGGDSLDMIAYPRDMDAGQLKDQWAVFPIPLRLYEDAEPSLWGKLKKRAMGHNGFNLAATIIFLCAIVHTFVASVFKEWAHLHEARHREMIEREKRRAVDKPQVDAKDDVSFRAHFFHFLGEVEAVFGIWVIALGGAVLWFFGIQEHGFGGISDGFTQLQNYLGHDVNYTEPLFVIVIMAIAATRPVIRLSEQGVDSVARVFGGTPAAWWFSTLTITPLLGSFITEPAAMTIAALLLAKKFYDLKPTPTFAYATIGLLFVNVSVGGTLTHFAAPPVLMVAAKWNWDITFMLGNFGWKAACGILVCNVLYFLVFRKHFAALHLSGGAQDMHLPLRWEEREDAVPAWVTLIHVLALAGTVLTAHYPALFIGGFLFLIGFTEATGHHQNDVKMRTPLLVGFFLAALVIHGGCQGWWIELLLTSIQSEWLLMSGSTILTAFNDNAAVTYLASQAPDLGSIAKYAVVAGAVTGGGLTVIANAPNPAGQSILGRYFEGGVSPLKLAMAAIVPTIIMGLFFMLIPSSGMHNGPAAGHSHSSDPGHHLDPAYQSPLEPSNDPDL
jgi:hypothetical protein